MEKEKQSINNSFLKPRTEKIVIFLIISTFVPLYVYMMLCGGFQPIFIFLFDTLFITQEANLFLVLLFSVPSLIFNYIFACLIYKILSIINKEGSKTKNWSLIAAILVISVLIFYFSLDTQGISC